MDSFPLQRRIISAFLLIMALVKQHQSFVITADGYRTHDCASTRCIGDTECVEHNGEARCYNTTCPVDEIFLLCSSKCEPTCDNINEECNKSCGPPGCQCRPGYVRDRGGCINRKSCSKITEETTSLSSVGRNYTATSSNCSTLVCETGHHCETVGDQAQCVPETRLSPTCALVDIGCLPGYHCEDTTTGMKCSPNRVDDVLKPVSRLTCEYAKLPPICSFGYRCEVINGNPECVPDNAPPRVSQSSCALLECPEDEYCEVFSDGPRCVATQGLCTAVFCASGQCVEYDGNFGCFDTLCGPNEEFRKCAICEPTCEQKERPCVNKCHPPACQCIQGFVRHVGRCVKSENCENLLNYGKFSKRFLQHPRGLLRAGSVMKPYIFLPLLKSIHLTALNYNKQLVLCIVGIFNITTRHFHAIV